MPIVAILLGAIMIDLAFRGTEHEFEQQLRSDFGGGEFVAWVAAIVVIGGLGYVPALRRISTVGMALLIVVLTLKNGGLFTQLASVVTNPPAASAPVPLASYEGGGGGGGGGGGILGALTGGSDPVSSLAGGLGSIFSFGGL